MQAAYQLVYQRYLKEGYQAPTPGKLRFVAHCCLPTTRTFIAKVQGKIIATLSLIDDRELGLPLEKEYPEEIARLRKQGHTLAEVSCLATRRFGDRSVLMKLMRAMYAYARYHLHITACCIAVHPRQQNFYQRVLLFENIGGEREYQACSKAPAIAMCMDLRDCEQRMAGSHSSGMIKRFFLGQQDYVRMAEELASVERQAVQARYVFSRSQLSRHAIDEAERQAIVTAYQGCFGISGILPRRSVATD